jgi:molybdenum cofactor biosynthesis enzyme MoaA
MPFVGMQASHRGNGLCCASNKRFRQPAKEFWEGKYIDEVRNKMIKGELVEDCTGCYNLESQGKISSRNHYNAVYKNLETGRTPTALDLDLSNLCNLQCVMCGPDRSSQWAKELGHKEITKTTKKELDEICALSSALKHLTIQGGEPSLMPEFEYYFEYLKDKKLIQNIHLDCISNLTNINSRFYQLLDDFKSVDLNVSIDSFGDANNYIRYPSNFEKIEKNLLALIDKDVQVNLQVTLQILSLYRFTDFLRWTTSIQTAFEEKNKVLGINLSYVSDPEFLSIQNAPKKLKQKFINDLKNYLPSKKTKNHIKFAIELKNLKNIILDTDNNNGDDRLLSYVNELDSRRGIKITNYIPDFYDYL